jgi:hypothetical protein
VQSADPIGPVGATISRGHLLLTTMHSDRLAGKTETFVRYGATERFEFGFGYLWKQGVVRPLASFTVLTERGHRPSLTGGLFFDSLGGGREAVFVSAGKSLRKPLGRPASIYLGGARISNEDRLRVIAGGNVALTRRLNASVQYDGKFVHVGLTRRVGELGGTPVHLGLVLTRGDALGPISAMDFHLNRPR